MGIEEVAPSERATPVVRTRKKSALFSLSVLSLPHPRFLWNWERGTWGFVLSCSLVGEKRAQRGRARRFFSFFLFFHSAASEREREVRGRPKEERREARRAGGERKRKRPLSAQCFFSSASTPPSWCRRRVFSQPGASDGCAEEWDGCKAGAESARFFPPSFDRRRSWTSPGGGAPADERRKERTPLSSLLSSFPSRSLLSPFSPSLKLRALDGPSCVREAIDEFDRGGERKAKKNKLAA